MTSKLHIPAPEVLHVLRHFAHVKSRPSSGHVSERTRVRVVTNLVHACQVRTNVQTPGLLHA